MRLRIKDTTAMLLVGVVIGGLIYIAAEAPPDDRWRKLIYEFQTLIAGIFAVFAAWWTVETMELTDKSAQRRHEQMMLIQSRPDALAVERFMSTVFPSIDATLRTITDLQWTQATRAEEFRDNNYRILEGIENIISNYSWHRTEQWIECEPLFGGPLKRASENFRSRANEVFAAAYAARTFRTVVDDLDSDGNFVEVPIEPEKLAAMEAFALSVVPKTEEMRFQLAILVRELRYLEMFYRLPN
jgi:hypothetical protein